MRAANPRAIAADLTSQGILTRKGNPWPHEIFVRGSLRHGMLGNQIYIGELEWNANRTIINPDSGSRTKRAAPKNELITVPVPHLRNFDQSLWDAANAVRTSWAKHKFGGDGSLPFVQHRTGCVPRTDYLLAGLLRCDACGGHMRLAGKPRGYGPRVGCAAASSHGTCQHSRTYDLDNLKQCVIDSLGKYVADPEFLAKMAHDYRVEFAKRDKQNCIDSDGIAKKLNPVQFKIDRTVVAIRDSDTPVSELLAQLKPLKRELADLTEQLRLSRADQMVASLHPPAIESHRLNVARLHEALARNSDTPESRAAFRNLIDSVVVHQTRKRMPYEVTLYCRPSRIVT